MAQVNVVVVVVVEKWAYVVNVENTMNYYHHQIPCQMDLRMTIVELEDRVFVL